MLTKYAKRVILYAKGGIAMLTNFGKALRKIRIDHSEFLKDMADKLGVTVAYLSAVENGKREVSDQWIDVLAEKYFLDPSEKKELQNYAYENKDNIKIDLSGIEKEEREMALAFARSFKSLTEADKKAIEKIFKDK